VCRRPAGDATPVKISSGYEINAYVVVLENGIRGYSKFNLGTNALVKESRLVNPKT
jgi:hypothetical protein